MLEDYKAAFAYFGKATRLYKKIGDKVSYAYTLWSLGATYKMTGSYGKALENFNRALCLFRQTKDPRGVIYCKLGFGEIALLKGDDAVAKKYISAAHKESLKYGFAVEACHAKVLLSSMTGRMENTCYNKIGVRLKFRKLPLNIP